MTKFTIEYLDRPGHWIITKEPASIARRVYVERDTLAEAFEWIQCEVDGVDHEPRNYRAIADGRTHGAIGIFYQVAVHYAAPNKDHAHAIAAFHRAGYEINHIVSVTEFEPSNEAG